MNIWEKRKGKSKSQVNEMNSSDSEDNKATVDYQHIKRLCSGPPGSSFAEYLEGDLKNCSPPIVGGKEGSFTPSIEEIKLAREAQGFELKGNQCMDTGLFKEAIAHFEQAANISKADGILYQNVAVAYHQLGDVANASRAIREALKREPNNERIQMNARALGVTDI